MRPTDNGAAMQAEPTWQRDAEASLRTVCRELQQEACRQRARHSIEVERMQAAHAEAIQRLEREVRRLKRELREAGDALRLAGTLQMKRKAAI